MRSDVLFSKYTAVFLIILFQTVFMGAAFADPISDDEGSPATAAEIQFINRVIDQVKAAVPALDGWERDLSSSLQGGFRQGEEILIYEYDRKIPLRLNLGFKFHRITAAEKKVAAQEKYAQELEKEMMEAAMSGNLEKMQQAQLQLSAMMQKQMEEAMGQGAGGEPGSQPPPGKPTEFYVRILVNDGGEHIGKKYDMTAPGVTHAFRLDKNKKDYLGYKYYLGGWEVSEFDRVNWKVIFPKSVQTPANHLRALVLYANVYGDRESVESYVNNSLDLKGLNSVLD